MAVLVEKTWDKSMRSVLKTEQCLLKTKLTMGKLIQQVGNETKLLFGFQNRPPRFYKLYSPGGNTMDVLKMLADLRQERAHIEEAILTLERLASGRGRRRGRPPAWMTAVKRRGRPPGSKNKPKESAAV